MPIKRPEFIKSPYFMDEPGNWHLKTGAPEDLKKEFERYMESIEVIPVEPGNVSGIHISYPYDQTD
ncbi:hypothetical protein [Bacillus sp. T33-2]|uniref:hypothetical protein n=1 Tax=Bacillus sp. T33-2 TaxID=2054168 RepID=UPI000C78B614|nr:hypothetical protein [Bacillus sp. T33-2]PLR94133.1 hypothetical protein CVD19_17780 [Bacillus sp. T33-2]